MFGGAKHTLVLSISLSRHQLQCLQPFCQDCLVAPGGGRVGRKKSVGQVQDWRPLDAGLRLAARASEEVAEPKFRC